MLFNLSNHPGNQWPESQLKAALETYGAITDLPFPQIPPELSSADLDLLVEDYHNWVKQADPLAVHIMGEMTFTFRLVTLLKKAGIPCIASTTERVTTIENDVKTSIFRFVKFREY